LRYGEPVTALWSFDEQPRTDDPLRPGAAPAAIRDALLAEDRSAFDTAYQRTLAAARRISTSPSCSGAWSTGGGSRCFSVTPTGSPQSPDAPPSD
jgi:hypothetical protein